MDIDIPAHGVTRAALVSHGVWRPLQKRRHRLGNGPHKADYFTCDGPGDDMGVFTLGDEALVACAQANLRLPTDVLKAVGVVCQA
jgi:hypothetical protein